MEPVLAQIFGQSLLICLKALLESFLLLLQSPKTLHLPDFDMATDLTCRKCPPLKAKNDTGAVDTSASAARRGCLTNCKWFWSLVEAMEMLHREIKPEALTKKTQKFSKKPDEAITFS